MIEAASRVSIEPIEFAEAKKQPAARKPAAKEPTARSTSKATSKAKKQAS
jgi:hypothetical protein